MNYNSTNEKKVAYTSYGGYGTEIICPKCGSDFMHHVMVDVFHRREDSSNGVHVSVSSSDHPFLDLDNFAKSDTDMAKNPSKRRQGLSIKFCCEECRVESTLDLIQHKGHSLLHWKGE